MPGKPKDDAKVVAELVTILGETKNVDTFLATLWHRWDSSRTKSPLPAVIRNAERLGLLTGLSEAEAPSHAQQIRPLAPRFQTTQELCAIPVRPHATRPHPRARPHLRGTRAVACAALPPAHRPDRGRTAAGPEMR